MSKLPYIHDEHLMAIGQVAIYAAFLDHMLEYMVFDLMYPHHESAKKILKSWTQDRQVDFVESMLTDKFPPFVREIEKFISGVKEARRARNEVVHYIWYRSMTKGS
jgi:hypothetical protein